MESAGSSGNSRASTPLSADSETDDGPQFFGAPVAGRWRPPRLAMANGVGNGHVQTWPGTGQSPPYTASPTTTSRGDSPVSPFFSASSSTNGYDGHNNGNGLHRTSSAASFNGYHLGRSHSVEVLTSSAPRSRHLSTLHRLARPPTPGSPPTYSPHGTQYYSPRDSKPAYSPFHDPHYSKYAKPPRTGFRMLALLCAVILIVGSAVMWWTVEVEKEVETGRLMEGKKPRYVLYRILGRYLVR